MPNRNEKGRFAKGHNVKSPGRRARPVEAEYLAAMGGAVSPEQWEKATVKMLGLALAGEVQAYKVLAPYFAGVPVTRLQISSNDAHILADVLEKYTARGIAPSEVFQAMLSVIAEQEAESDEPE